MLDTPPKFGKFIFNLVDLTSTSLSTNLRLILYPSELLPYDRKPLSPLTKNTYDPSFNSY